MPVQRRRNLHPSFVLAGALAAVLAAGCGGSPQPAAEAPATSAHVLRNFTLIDGTQKKIRFVSEGIDALGLRNAQAVAARAENFGGPKDFDAVVVRAVGTLAEVLHNTRKLLAPHGRLLAMKGRSPDDETAGLPRGWRAEVTRLRVPGLDAERHLVAISHQHSARG